VRVLDDNDVYVERAFYYDYMGRVIQTVEKNHLGQISRYSTKYDFVGNILAQHESHKTGSATADVKLTTFVYDVRGRLLSERTVINGSDTAKVEYKYNELGQQIAKIYDSNLIIDSTKYNIQGWITEKQAKNTENDNIFAMNLNYYNPAKPSAAPSYTGNITEWTWRHENLQENTYTFGYDKLSRLKESLMYIDNVQTNSFTEQGFTYDKNGNIKTLKRHGETDLIHDLTLEYSGNRLWTVNQTPAYWYDANGNMNKDYRKNLDFEYNLLNLPYQILQNDTVKATFTYIADGTKAGATDSAGNGFDYLGSLVYVKNNNIRTLESTGFGGGRINKTNNSYDINYFITDHLGSTRAIVSANGSILEQKDYYPFGKEHENANLMSSTNRWNFSGKEKQIIRDLGWLDFSARMYANDEIPIFTTQDPLAEKYYSISPYAYCANNPLRFIDPNGMDWYQNNDTKYYTWYDGNEERKGYTYIGERGSVLGEFESIIDNLLTETYKVESMFSEGFTFDIVQNDKGAWDLFYEFVSGEGSEFSVFLSDHPYTEEMKTDNRVLQSQKAIANSETDISGQITNVRRKWYPWNVLMTTSMAKQFIGSYRFDAFTGSDGKSLNNVISDSKNLKSLMLHLTPGSWNKNRSDRRVLGNTYQFYIWQSSKKK
jgi:RHS repeat-associated protein